MAKASTPFPRSLRGLRAVALAVGFPVACYLTYLALLQLGDAL